VGSRRRQQNDDVEIEKIEMKEEEH